MPPKRNKSRKNKKSSSQNIPTPNNSTKESRANKKPISTVAIESVKRIVEALKPYELSSSQRLRTYQSMMLDDAVGAAFSANCVLIEKAFANYKVKFDKNSPNSVAAGKFLSHNLANLRGQTVRSIARSGAEFKRDGVAPFEKLFRKGRGDYKDNWVLDKLNYVSPLTLDNTTPFSIANGGRTVVEMRQSLSAFDNSNDAMQYWKLKSTNGYVPIPMSKVALMTYSATDAQPFGLSAFDSCYTAWREKVLLQDFTLVGVSKDLSGMALMKIPSDILATASADPSSDAGVMVEQLKTNMANMSTSDQSYTILPSDTLNDAGTGNTAFELKFLGIEGSGKNFELTELVEQRKKAIYNAFGAANLLAGEGSGSYNLIEGQNSIHSFYVERDIAIIEETWNTNIIPQLFRLNEWDLSEDERPKLVAGSIEPVSLDESGKYFNRVMRSLPAVPAVVNHLLEQQDIPYRIPEDYTPKQIREVLFDFQEESKVGGGDSGTTQSGGQNSDNNSENTA